MSHYQFLSPFTFKNGMTIKNRIVIPPMTECSSLADGSVSSDELRYFEARTGAVGMFIAPATPIQADGKGAEGQLSVASDKFIPSLTKLATAIKQNGTKAILQLYHAGRMTNSTVLRGVKPVSASSIPAERPDAETPRELTSQEVQEIVENFGYATRRAIEAGFDGVELHGANTYLIQQFFSPHSNRRTDKWGGDIHGRMTFALEIIKTVQETVKKYARQPFLVGFRLSPEELETPGIRLADTLEFVDVLSEQAIDYIHVSLGNVWTSSLNKEADSESVLLKIKDQVASRKPLISVGGIETPQEAEKVIQAGIDFVAIGTEYIREPLWLQKVELGQEDTIRYSVAEADLEKLAITPVFLDFMNEIGTKLNLKNN